MDPVSTHVYTTGTKQNMHTSVGLGRSVCIPEQLMFKAIMINISDVAH